MPKLPTICAKDFIKTLLRRGYVLDRISGSHHIFRNDHGNRVVVAVHGNKEIPKGTLLAMMKDAEITREDL